MAAQVSTISRLTSTELESVLAAADDRAESTNQEDVDGAISQTSRQEDIGLSRLVVNILASGGTANGNVGGDSDPFTLIRGLAYEVAILSKKVEYLSSPASRSGPIIESGTWNTTEVRPGNKPHHSTEARINFSKEFKLTPMVMVSVSSVDFSNFKNYRVKVYATEVNPRGFIVHADTWGSTLLYSCGVSWMAVGE
ncbi:uncharacterized protein GGS22DRAFT_3982 [Annulohypoxylon maeteangense]|uniref:uncharacterized protein n=1 Tax=Annulohypoxylon maeteangense TaxID=1927788 RepID=UPI0020088FFA|nr:uncharacterized protein GGS22DRAFT_3982 [Annulohypoxylon maeteangense]KAI0889776.1 hypothetical protein GGS22DRAFT_3982 [Annulohypoxylon maeteangense]